MAAHAAHVAYHMEVVALWENGERGPFDWKGSFTPGKVTEADWPQLQARVQSAYTALLEVAQRPTDWDDEEEGAAGSMAGALAHVAYHLGAIRQVIKLVN